MKTLSASHLQKTYAKRMVVTDVSLEVHAGEIVGLLGPNGAGKTTTFYMIIGLVPQDAGQIKLDNQDISHLPMHGRAQAGVGYLPQEASIFRKLTVEQNLMALLQTRKDLNKQAQREKMQSLLEEFHIEHIQHSLGMSLSGGERRRVEIARALTTDPAFILLDEPFAGVDPIAVADIQKIVRHLQKRGIGVLITDHNVRETLSLCERAYIVGDGKIIAHGSAQEIVQNEQVKAVYLGNSFSL